MKLLIDLSNHHSIYSGVTIYAMRLISGFKKNGYKDVNILCHPNIYETIFQYFPYYTCIESKQSRCAGICGKIITAYLVGKQINSFACDVVFRPALSPSIFFTKCKVVQTIHDLQGVKINRGIKKWFTYFFIGMSLWRSHSVITISNFVKKEIMRYYPFISLDKFETIYNSVIVKSSVETYSPIASSYLLYVGMLREYKNLITLLKAFNRIQNQIKQNLVIIGRPVGDYLLKIVWPYIQANNLASRIILITDPVSDELLVRYYQCADLLVHPSLLEGFGYTPIEAAMLGTPVLTNKETALYETTMGLLNYYEPACNDEVLAHRIIEILATPPSQERLFNIAHKLALQYDECRQAQKVWRYLEKAL